MGFKRHATAVWEGDLKTGQGRMSTPQSGLFEGTRYSFGTRFGDEKGTNPEELVAAAHAGCFSMALGFILQNAGHVATRRQRSTTTRDGPNQSAATLSGAHCRDGSEALPHFREIGGPAPSRLRDSDTLDDCVGGNDGRTRNRSDRPEGSAARGQNRVLGRPLTLSPARHAAGA